MPNGQYRVAVKDSAAEHSGAVEEFRAERGRTVVFESRADAEATAERLSTPDARVAVQAAAPQDGSDADAYLVPDPDRRTRDPDGSVDAGLTFDVSATQYGRLGEALVCCQRWDPPVLAYYAREDLAADDVRVELDRDPDAVVTDDGARWVPDCRAVARTGNGRTLAEYWCEIKTGDASLERDQRTAMTWQAQRARVLTVRVDPSALPESYTARIRAVGPVDGSTNASRVTHRLSDFK
ncbi:hypothetical protein [Halomicrococcus gelatinilyticus]|uniref:hypothetical protein n=1 Tax=Halomicrococcus gelatinilyticus TaxID=1702103 RepID=UPI002E0D5222